MSGKCATCNIDFSPSDIVAKCVECCASFHPACTRAGSVQNFKKLKSKTWKCDSCKDETSSHRSGNGSSDMKRFFTEALNSVKEEINSNISKKLTGVQDAIASLSDEMKHLSHKIGALENQQQDLKTQCENLERDKASLTSELQELRQQFQDADQHSRAANIEIVGLPATNGENIYDCLQKVASAVGVPYKREDVSLAHRLRIYSKKHSHPPIIAQFVSRSVKESWLAAARTRRILDASDISQALQPSRVFINDHLTSFNKALLGKARRLVRERKLYYAGYFNGKVLVRPKEGDDTVRVREMVELNKFERQKY